jgi:hypothetical protein
VGRGERSATAFAREGSDLVTAVAVIIAVAVIGVMYYVLRGPGARA